MSTSGCVATATSRRARLPAIVTSPQPPARSRSIAAAGRHRRDARPIARDLRRQQLRVLAGGQADHPQPIGVRVDDRQRALADRAGRAEDGDRVFTRTLQQRMIVEHRRGEQQRVDAIEHAAVAGNQRRAVLHAGAALQHRLEQIARDAERDHASAEQRRAARAARRQPPGADDDEQRACRTRTRRSRPRPSSSG